jgi:hypothetical protein
LTAGTGGSSTEVACTQSSNTASSSSSVANGYFSSDASAVSLRGVAAECRGVVSLRRRFAFTIRIIKKQKSRPLPTAVANGYFSDASAVSLRGGAAECRGVVSLRRRVAALPRPRLRCARLPALLARSRGRFYPPFLALHQPRLFPAPRFVELPMNPVMLSSVMLCHVMSCYVMLSCEFIPHIGVLFPLFVPPQGGQR